MHSYYIKFASVTTAQRAAQLFKSKGILTRLGKNPGYTKGEGCSHALFLQDKPDYALQLLSENGIRYKGTGEVNTR